MVKRTIDLSPDSAAGPARLRVEHDQLVIIRDQTEVGRVPIEDIGYLILNDPAISLTHGVLTRISHYGGVVLVCNAAHTPEAILLPLEGNELTARRLRAQAALSLPKRKRLWQQIVRHKVIGQALNLPESHPHHARLLGMAARVQSGDKTHIEGQAARFYWPALLGEGFRRDPDGPPPNNLLNYGYAVFRAACARAIVAAGLHPVFSLQHSHRNNTFALADDLLELFRPHVDRTVQRLWRDGVQSVDKPAKQKILGLLAEPLVLAGQAGPLMVQLARITASLVDCIEGRRTRMEMPEQTVKGLRLLPNRYAHRPDDPEFDSNSQHRFPD